ncbi:ECF transporter S component [Christensenella sp. MSJ-20]|uniref:ECF transporter S component n=1 Tax=Christensenella sp. MSJ-20 TaxID=2841518 RepID=UPI001C76C0CF|nr:ECF transporter S component [Christensenella sp. MSJ-20]
MNQTTKRLTVCAMLAAAAYVVMAIGRIPVVLFLSYDPKDIIIAIGGFLYGPLSAMGISVVVSLLEMVTVSGTGFIGCIMNILSTCSFVCVASYLYRKKRTPMGAFMGLLVGCLVMTGVMLLWNYLITPLYMGYPREAVAALLLPAFLPFNLLKGGLNAAGTFLLYRPLSGALQKSGLVPREESTNKGHFVGIALVAALLLATCILLVLAMQGVI